MFSGGAGFYTTVLGYLQEAWAGVGWPRAGVGWPLAGTVTKRASKRCHFQAACWNIMEASWMFPAPLSLDQEGYCCVWTVAS